MALNRPHRLLAYDWTIFRRSFQAAFSRPQDILLLILVALISFAFLRDTVMRTVAAGLPSAAWLGVALIGLIAFSGQGFLLARLRWFVVHSPLAGDALQRRSSAAYLAAGHLLLLLLVIPFLWILGLGLRAPAAAEAAGAAAYLGGALLGGLAALARRPLARLAESLVRPTLRPPGRGIGRAAVFDLILRRQTGGARPAPRAALILAAGFGAALLVGLFATGTSAAVAILGFAFFGLLMLGRTDAEALGILPFAGYPPLFVAACYAALPSAFAAAVALGTALSPLPGRPIVLTGIGLMLAGLLLIGIASCWLYPGRGRRSVHLQVQLEFSGLVLVAWLVPPLAPVAIAWRMWALHRRGRSLLWLRI